MRFGRTCASVVIGSGLLAGGLFAYNNEQITIDLPHAVTVGSVTLPSGHYTISGVEMNAGQEYFVVRGENTPVVTLQAQKIEENTSADRTHIDFLQDGSSWHFDKLIVAGEGTGYQFLNAK